MSKPSMADRILKLVAEQDMPIIDIAVALGITSPYCRTIIQDLRIQKEIHIGSWKSWGRSKVGDINVACYRAGRGQDAERPLNRTLSKPAVVAGDPIQQIMYAFCRGANDRRSDH